MAAGQIADGCKMPETALLEDAVIQSDPEEW